MRFQKNNVFDKIIYFDKRVTSLEKTVGSDLLLNNCTYFNFRK